MTVTRSPGKAMTRLMMNWSSVFSLGEQVRMSLELSPLTKTIICPRFGMYSRPRRWENVTGRRLTMMRSSAWRVFSIL